MSAIAADIGPYRRSAPFFAALLIAAIPAFWPSYFFPPRYEIDWHVHLHGVALFAWAMMLIAQPWLVHAGKLRVHRAIGKASFVIAPVIVISTILLARYRIHESTPTFDQLYFLYVQAALMTFFSVAYVQAIRWRRSAGMHARYMVCTAIAMVDPILARILYNYAGIDIPWLQWVTYLLCDVILLTLWLRDQRVLDRAPVFPGMLALLVLLQVPTFVLPHTAAWQSIGLWFGRLPLP